MHKRGVQGASELGPGGRWRQAAGGDERRRRRSGPQRGARGAGPSPGAPDELHHVCCCRRGETGRRRAAMPPRRPLHCRRGLDPGRALLPGCCKCVGAVPGCGRERPRQSALWNGVGARCCAPGQVEMQDLRGATPSSAPALRHALRQAGSVVWLLAAPLRAPRCLQLAPITCTRCPNVLSAQQPWRSSRARRGQSRCTMWRTSPPRAPPHQTGSGARVRCRPRCGRVPLQAAAAAPPAPRRLRLLAPAPWLCCASTGPPLHPRRAAATTQPARRAAADAAGAAGAAAGVGAHAGAARLAWPGVGAQQGAVGGCAGGGGSSGSGV